MSDLFITDRMSIPSKREKTPEGYLLIKDCRLARPGVLRYRAMELAPYFQDRDPESEVLVYRSDQTLFSPMVLKSLQSKPVTNNHHGPVTSRNSKDFSVGYSKDDVSVQDGHVTASLMVTDAQTIEDIESGRKEELSLGTHTRLNMEAVMAPDGTMCDAEIVHIAGNHIAVVEKGRNGPTCRISDAQTEKPQTEENAMDLVAFVHDGITHQLTPQGIELVTKLQKALKGLNESHSVVVQDHAAAIEKLNAEHQSAVDTLQAKLDEANSRILTEDALEARITERMDLQGKVKKVLPDYDCTGKDSAVIKKDVVAAKCKGVNVEDSSADYINARFDALLETTPENGYQQTLGETATTITQDAEAQPSGWRKKQAEMIEANRKKWEGK